MKPEENKAKFSILDKPKDGFGFIYMITSPSGKRYIGLTTNDIMFRLANHANGNNCGLLKAAIKKYGKENMRAEILECVPIQKLGQEESKLIKKFRTMVPNGYNLTTGGEHPRPSPRTREKMRATHKGMKSSEETKRKIGEANRRRIYTPEMRANLGKNAKGKKFIRSEEFRAKLSKALMGHIVSAETRKKIGDANRGTKRSEETKMKMSLARHRYNAMRKKFDHF